MRVVARDDAIEIALATGDVPQNVNFVFGTGTARVPRCRGRAALIECWN